MILEVSDLHKTFVGRSGEKLTILTQISLSVEVGSSCALVGPSGSGKTTLLGLCAGLDSPTSGQITFDGQNLAELTEDERAQVRRSHMGFVFQNFQLIPNLTALENVMLPLELASVPYAVAVKRGNSMLERVGLGARAKHLPTQLSGGEQQRVALARAVVHQPKIIFADEPTGNLDAENSEKVTDMLFSLNRESKTSLVLVTHNMELAGRTERILALKGGRVVAP